MIKIFFYSEYPNGCYYYRAEVVSRYLGGDFEVRSNVDFNNHKILRDTPTYEKMFDSDVVVFIRPTQKDSLLLFSLLQMAGKKVVYSTDDLFAHLDPENPYYHLKNGDEVTAVFASQADAILVTTDTLFNEFKKYNKKVSLIPNYIDVAEYKKLKKSIKNDHMIRLGIVGSVQTAENIGAFIDTLEIVHKKNNNVEIIFFGNEDPKTIDKLKKKFKNRAEFINNVTTNQYPEKLASLSLDISLIPRKDNLFNRAKSNCKYLEMALLNIPVIAQGFPTGDSPYQRDIQDGVNGLIAIEEEEWLKKINILISNTELRKNMGLAAEKYVEENFDIKSQIGLWRNFLTETKDTLSITNSSENVNQNLQIGYLYLRNALDVQTTETEKIKDKYIDSHKGKHLSRVFIGKVMDKDFVGAHKTLLGMYRYPISRKMKIFITIFRISPNLTRLFFILFASLKLVSPYYGK